VDARILLVPLALVVSIAGEHAGCGDARYGENERNGERQSASSHRTSFQTR
jgi:hypothetical protein